MPTRVVFDFDLEDLDQVFRDCEDTIKYCEDIKKSLSERVLKGEEINGLGIVNGRSTRFITKKGEGYLSDKLGYDKIHETKLIGITKLEKLLTKEELDYLESNGLVETKEGPVKVVSFRKDE